jgi:hypothetical protein
MLKKLFLKSRYTKLFPHLFTNSGADWTHIRQRTISESEAIDKILFNFEGN